MMLKEEVENISNFSKRIILTILENSFPCPMPYPVMNTIQSYLLPVQGAGNIGLVSNDEIKEVERSAMENLYLAMAEVYDHVKMIMFYIEPMIIEPFLHEKKAILVEKFEILVAVVDRSQLQLDFEGLGLGEDEAGEKVK